MKIKGSITIYLSIVILSIIMLVCVISESARVNEVHTESKSFTYMAVNSVLAGYAKQIYDDYGVLLVWENQDIEDKLKSYIQDNIELADLKTDGTNLMNTNLVNLKINERGYVTDEEGEKFVKQIIDYMKYAAPIKAVDDLTRKYDKYKKSNDLEKNIDNSNVTDITDEQTEKLQKLVADINKAITDLKDTKKLKGKMTAASQKLEELHEDIMSGSKNRDAHDKKVRQFLKKYKKLITILDIKASDVDGTIKLIKQYEIKKELFLKKHGGTTGEGDYIDEDLEKLEKVQSKIIEIKGLNVSEFPNVDLNNINIAIKAQEDTKAVEKYLWSLKLNQATEEDKKNQSLYEKAKTFLESGVLSLVIDDISDISKMSISKSNLPTNLKEEKNDKSILETTRNKGILALYSHMKFGNYLKEKDDSPLKYEMEYVINGKYSDKENMAATVEKIAGVRNVIDLIYLVSDKKKMAEISTVAASAATALAMPFLEPVIKVVLIESWSLAEATSDVRILLKKEKLPFVKTSDNWRTSLANLDSSINTKSKSGLDYESYLEVLIMIESNHNIVYRLMDLIQLNVQKKYNSQFLISKSFQKLKVQVEFTTDPLFTSMPWILNGLSENNAGYDYSIVCNKEY